MAPTHTQQAVACFVGAVCVLVFSCVHASEELEGFDSAVSGSAEDYDDLGLPGGGTSSHGRSSRSGTILGVLLLLVAAVAVRSFLLLSRFDVCRSGLLNTL